jgi:hypothetical protein
MAYGDWELEHMTQIDATAAGFVHTELKLKRVKPNAL